MERNPDYAYSSFTEAQHDKFLSIIMPAHNAEHTLGEQLEALKQQDYQGEWEIVLVVNRSTDNTLCIAQSYQRQFQHLRIIDAPEKRGAAYARNVGVRAAKGNAFVFCDADDVASQNWLSMLAEALNRSHVVAGCLDYSALNYEIPALKLTRVFGLQPHLDFLPMAITANFAVTRVAFEAVGGFAEDFLMCEDADISWRLQLSNYKIATNPAIMHYRQRQTFRAIFRQSILAGEAEVHLYKRFAVHGMPRSSGKTIWNKYRKLVKKTPLLLVNSDQGTKAIQLRKYGRTLGRLIGSIRYRTCYL